MIISINTDEFLVNSSGVWGFLPVRLLPACFPLIYLDSLIKDH